MPTMAVLCGNSSQRRTGMDWISEVGIALGFIVAIVVLGTIVYNDTE
jgi:hypothetical protein